MQFFGEFCEQLECFALVESGSEPDILVRAKNDYQIVRLDPVPDGSVILEYLDKL
jgi:hypothetical protein